MADELLYFPFYIGDYLKDTMSFTQQERGAYIDLCVAYIQNDGKLPDDERLFILTRCSTDLQRTAVATVVERAFERSLEQPLSYIVSKKLDILIGKQKSLRNQRVEAGKASAEARAEKQRALERALQQSESNPESESKPHSNTKSNPKKEEDSKGDFFNVKNDLGLDFDILNFLTPELDMYARETARIINLDFQVLVNKYNTLVKRDPPKFPNKAFMAWLESYTKPIIQKRNRR